MYFASNISHLVINKENLYTLLTNRSQHYQPNIVVKSTFTITIMMHRQPKAAQLTECFYLFYSFYIRPGQQSVASFQHLMYKDSPSLSPWHVSLADRLFTTMSRETNRRDVAQQTLFIILF
jgi:hypothetical protein